MSDTPADEDIDDGRDSVAAGTEDDPFEGLDEFGDLSDPEIDLEGAFEEIEVPEIDEQEVWDALFSEAERSVSGIHPELSDADSTVEGADAVVEKSQYCQRCEFFSEPPTVACTNPDTEIVELVGIDRFRVRNCPVVSHRERAQSALPDN